MIAAPTQNWTTVCRLDDILPDTGVAVLHAGRQIALFRIGNTDNIYALSNHDPFTHANVLSRGIIGDHNGQYKVTSPLLKHAFNLKTGASLDDPTIQIPTYPARVQNQTVQLMAD
jgi:nitrite reductase (NADH) small subunit